MVTRWRRARILLALAGFTTALGAVAVLWTGPISTWYHAIALVVVAVTLFAVAAYADLRAERATADLEDAAVPAWSRR